MSFETYNQLVEFLGIEPETKGEERFFNLIWKYMREDIKEKVYEIDL